jgi:hypothetical protein
MTKLDDEENNMMSKPHSPKENMTNDKEESPKSATSRT